MSTVGSATSFGAGNQTDKAGKKHRKQQPEDTGGGPSGLADTTTGASPSVGAGDTGFSAIG